MVPNVLEACHATKRKISVSLGKSERAVGGTKDKVVVVLIAGVKITPTPDETELKPGPLLAIRYWRIQESGPAFDLPKINTKLSTSSVLVASELTEKVRCWFAVIAALADGLFHLLELNPSAAVENEFPDPRVICVKVAPVPDGMVANKLVGVETHPE